MADVVTYVTVMRRAFGEKFASEISGVYVVPGRLVRCANRDPGEDPVSRHQHFRIGERNGTKELSIPRSMRLDRVRGEGARCTIARERYAGRALMVCVHLRRCPVRRSCLIQIGEGCFGLACYACRNATDVAFGASVIFLENVLASCLRQAICAQRKPQRLLG